ncbi:hypothetical protein Ae168Ps1_6219c [Pseudonocardia sp. Ae168_Ps1]|nr:hypothetical protein Ae168Ps1_6219c [Pseudonocardia sp. Ae168_Ps1]OLL71592.1 hypothetical protein Ae263Ps1_6080c [Pseudonocardia sp. Ae263_Ps1]
MLGNREALGKRVDLSALPGQVLPGVRVVGDRYTVRGSTVGRPRCSRSSRVASRE